MSILHAIPESDPKCTTNLTENKAMAGDYVEYSCAVKYSGKWAPVMACRYNGEVVKAKDESSGNTTKYTYVTKLTTPEDIYVFTCRTYFDQPKPGTVRSKEASNKPTTDNVLTDCTSPYITVYCKYGLHCLLTVSVNYSHLLTIVLCHCSTMSIYNVIQRANHALSQKENII